jgi:hypothetical protein
MALQKVGTGMIANDAVTLDKMVGGVDGNIISYDAAGDPVAVVTGTSGQVFTSAGAGAPPTFAAAAAGGSTAGIWTSITKTTISNVAEVLFTATDSSLYVDYLFVFRDLVSATDNVLLQLGFASDGPSSPSWLYSSYGYTYDKKNLHTSSAIATTGGENTFPRLTDEMSNTTGEGVSLELLIFSPHVATTMTNFVWSGAHLADDGTKKGIQGWGLRAVAASYNAFRFNTNSGNMTSGEFEVYGRTT